MSQFDKNLKVGDIILAYRGGVHRVTAVEQRFYGVSSGGIIPQGMKKGEEYSSLIRYSTISVKGKLSKAQHACDAVFCHKLTNDIIKKGREDELKKINDRYDAMQKILDAG